MMFSVNIITLFFNLAILLISGTLLPSLDFCLTHHEILRDILLVGLLTILGQVSIYYVVINFKQHMFPLVATTRKILTILYSIYYFRHPTNLYMWICLVLVFGGIIYELADELYYDLSGEKPTKVPREKIEVNP
jgi:drug/metabolite transporter (DMT)-like permease